MKKLLLGFSPIFLILILMLSQTFGQLQKKSSPHQPDEQHEMYQQQEVLSGTTLTTESNSTNLTQEKPTTWRRLNSNGYSQRYTKLNGANRTERIQELLDAYELDSTESRPAIRTIARIHHVYPEVIICIAYADSSLGRFLKTEYNYGNVGNNDRGDTQKYTNFEQGMNAIAKTLNNRYLGDYISIDQLSRYGNKDRLVYATSTENRHINVMNCMGMIYNKEVPDNFAFRW